MKNEELLITISGQSGSGKSRMLYLIKNMLRSMEFNVEHDINSNMDFVSEEYFDEHMERNLPEILGNIIDTRDIVIKEVQTNRSLI